MLALRNEVDLICNNSFPTSDTFNCGKSGEIRNQPSHKITQIEESSQENVVKEVVVPTLKNDNCYPDSVPLVARHPVTLSYAVSRGTTTP